MAQQSYPVVPTRWPNIDEWLFKLATAINSLRDGKINSVGEITLTINSATSTLADRRIGPDSVILLMPTTANASAEFGNGTIYVSARGKQTATITHANNSNSDRTFGYTVLG